MQDLIQRKLSTSRLFCKFFRWFFFSLLTSSTLLLGSLDACVMNKKPNEIRSHLKTGDKDRNIQGKRHFYMHVICKHEHWPDMLIFLLTTPKQKTVTLVYMSTHNGHAFSLSLSWPFANAYQVTVVLYFSKKKKPKIFVSTFKTKWTFLAARQMQLAKLLVWSKSWVLFLLRALGFFVPVCTCMI